VAVSSTWAEEMDEADIDDVRAPRQQVSQSSFSKSRLKDKYVFFYI
jgi:hypothetical protein